MLQTIFRPAAPFVTGVVLAVDGDESIYHPYAPPASDQRLAAWDDGVATRERPLEVEP